ncbi:pectate lyase [Panaeolus papilionaceus]|nr:pectate lyase [Panaeolus papilionaceus]
MKWISSVFVLALISVVSGTPLEKRAGPNDTANIGYATINGGTTGGSGGTVTTVSTLAALTSAVSGNNKKVVIISGSISGATSVKVGSNTSVLGKPGAVLNGVGLTVNGNSNVIIRNLKINKVLASSGTGDAINIQYASKIWIDHVELWSDRDHDKDYYVGLLDITHGCTEVTVSYSKLHDHHKGSLIGADNSNTEDKAVTVTYAYNHFYNIGSRMPSIRFGKGHIYNNLFENSGDGINTRIGAQVLVENNVFSGVSKPLYSTDNGYAVARGNDFGGKSNTAPAGDLNSVPYGYGLVAAVSVRSSVSGAGATLSGF